MASKEQLQQVSADSVYQEACKKGYYRAVNQSVGNKPNAVDEWYSANEAFADPQVKELLSQGEDNSLERLIIETKRSGLTLFIETPKQFIISIPEKHD